MKVYDSVLLAKYMMALAYEKRIVLNVTKVQKLLYIVYGYYLSKYNHPITVEMPKAWPYGPVFPRTRKEVDYTNILPLSSEEFKEIREDQELTEVLNRVIEKYAPFSASRLSDWSHIEGGPWDKTTKQKGFDWSHPIPNEYIAEYFSSMNI
ncbi:DUF4065 domain-containing protein [Pontibacter sp. 172403-2]|uniref:Panacea domain-containing protein n=1 Tax=Pontibacter rufus TaxID=2791028 RepID=UPI0018AF985D|nr:type II toxin-antitoxin system antitoxin SocA domain-containing protein [Pontibacter sp. 172403-2]MBF9253073.1 DUF4065 domain-containing protein [Pontibacter sp. 172403-2]